MPINAKKGDVPPPLYIEDTELEIVKELGYLGDILNDKGNNDSLIEDRVKRGISAMIRSEALVRETGLGIHTINVHLLLYRSLFVSCMIFNSQAWSNLSEKNINSLEKFCLLYTSPSPRDS